MDKDVNNVVVVQGSSFSTFEPFKGYFIISPETAVIQFNGTGIKGKIIDPIEITTESKTFSIGDTDEELEIVSMLNKTEHNGVRIEYHNSFMHVYRKGNSSVLSNNKHIKFEKGIGYMVTSTSKTNSTIVF